MKVPTVLLSLCLFVGPVLAQTSWFPREPETDTTAPGSPPREEGDGSVSVGETVTAGATPDCMVLATTTPRRIPPGGSGTVIVTLALSGDAVITADTQPQVTCTGQQGVLTFGAATVRPAKQTLGSGPLSGQKAYDESVMIEIPVSVASEARNGELVAGMRVDFELKNVRSGFSKGRFATGVTASIDVGDPLPIFPGTGAAALAAGNPPLPDLPAVESATAGPAGGTPAQRRRPGAVGRGVFGEAATETREATLPSTPGELPGFSLHFPPMLLVALGAGALALLAILGLLATRLIGTRRS